MGLAKGRGRGSVAKTKGPGPFGKPPPLMGRPLTPHPGMGLRPRGPPGPPLIPRMRPPPPPLPGMRSRLLPPPPHHLMGGPPRPPLPPFHPPPPHARLLPPPLPPRPPVPPPVLLRPRGQGLPPPMPGLRPGFRPPVPPMVPKFVPGKRNMPPQKVPKKKQKVKKIEMNDDSDINKPWITEAMKNEIQKKQRIYRKAKKSNQQSDWDEFREQKNRVATMIKEAKLEYIGSHPEEVGELYCDTCDQKFDSSENLEHHISEHGVCGLEGCTFTAHPKIVAKHIDMQHRSGLFKRMSSVYSAEDVSKWIEERKRRYPTKTNIERKQSELQEKSLRGEILSKSKSRFNKDIRKRQAGRQQRRPTKKQRRTVTIESDESDESDGASNANKNLCCFPGTKMFKFDESEENCTSVSQDNFSDTEWETPMNNSVSSIPTACKALSNIMTFYASDLTDSEDEAPNEVPIQREDVASVNPVLVVTPSTSTPNPSKQTERTAENESNITSNAEVGEMQNVCSMENANKLEKCNRNEENGSVDRNKPCAYKNRQKLNTSNREPWTRNQKRTVSSKLRTTLLQKLLEREIIHERNVILQCIRYVVKTEFLTSMINSDSKTSTTERTVLQCKYKPECEDIWKYKKNVLCQSIRYIVQNNLMGVQLPIEQSKIMEPIDITNSETIIETKCENLQCTEMES